VQLGSPAPERADALDVPSALERARRALGNRPAVTILSPRGREEQAVASLAQWAAKGAHLLEADLLLDPGDALRLQAPWSWPTAAVCLAAWWAGLVVDLDGSEAAEVAVVDEGMTPPEASEVLWLGDSVRGGPRSPTTEEAWTTAVQAFPDQPPRSRGTSEAPALRSGGRVYSQSELLVMARDLGDGTLGVAGDRPENLPGGGPAGAAATGLVALALRPVVVGRPTVVLRGVPRSAADGERVRRWWPDPE
jgi:uncharacterized protein (TIGR03089 family)